MRVTKSFPARGFGSFDGTKEHEKHFNRYRLPTLNLFLGDPLHQEKIFSCDKQNFVIFIFKIML